MRGETNLEMGVRRRSRRVTVAVILALVALLGMGVVYVAAGYLAYEDLSVVHDHCTDRSFSAATPADFSVSDTSVAKVPDAAPYHFTDFSDVSFPTRGGGLTIRGWYAPPRTPGGPVVIAVHGYDSCRRDWAVLLPAGMLHRAGFGVLLPDLRNHGESDSDGGRWAGGAKEYLDVLGAWDWLRGRGVPAARIGLLGVSLGAATVTIATGEEPRVAATWADSPYASFSIAAAEYAESKGYPGWVAGPAIPIGRLLGDPALGTHDPADEVLRLAGRPFFIVQGMSDTTIRPHNAIDLSVAAEKAGTSIEPWLIPGAQHIREMLLVTDRYEQRLVSFFAGAIGRP
ncbi:MAG TPA: alpha/beta fold hydrolase [Candidatus Dormibacteraeota bacterium]|nr:alpha/beta fold hydrolase [Candidatus Dormibacteraeota bacterium]